MYLALNNDCGIYLLADYQMDIYLSKGYSIYYVENGSKTLIATPDDGFLVPRPIFPVREG